MRIHPVRQRFSPARLRKGQAGGAEHGHEEVRLADLAGQPVDHHRYRVAGIVDKGPLAADMGLAHRHRQPLFPAAVERAEPAVTVAVGIGLDILVPHYLQRHVLALQLAVDRGPVRLRALPLTDPAGRHAVQCMFQRRIRHADWHRPRHLRRSKPL